MSQAYVFFDSLPLVDRQDYDIRSLQWADPQISEADFWLRYFQSQLWERQRASERRTVNDDTARRKDDIFDQYLEDPDWSVLAPSCQAQTDNRRTAKRKAA